MHHREYVSNGSLDQLLAHIPQGPPCPSFWNATETGIVICGIVLGMRYSHYSGIIHGNSKPSNILLNERRHPSICDFGSSRFPSDDAAPTPDSGAVYYAAPEQYVDGAALTEKIDVFSFGLIGYERIIGSPVFSSSDSPCIVIRRLRAQDLPKPPGSCGYLLQSLICRGLRTNPE
jgi:serine/threonine protein kinase